MKRAQKYKEFFHNYFYLCDICKSKIYLDTEVRWSCKSWEEIGLCGKEACCSVVTLMVVLFGVAFVVVGVVLLGMVRVDVVLYYGIGLGGLIITIALVAYLFEVLLGIELVIHGIAKKDKKKATGNQVMP